jgi:hypothetical protein
VFCLDLAKELAQFAQMAGKSSTALLLHLVLFYITFHAKKYVDATAKRPSSFQVNNNVLMLIKMNDTYQTPSTLAAALYWKSHLPVVPAEAPAEVD